LSLDTDLLGKARKIAKNSNTAKDTIIEWSLVLVDGSTSTSGRVRPVDFVSLTNFHADTVLPVEFLSEFFIVLVVVTATESTADVFISSKLAAQVSGLGVWSRTHLVEFTNGKVLSSQMPMDIDGAHVVLEVGGLDWLMSDDHFTLESHGDVSSSLRKDVLKGVDQAVNVVDLDLLSFALVRTSTRRSGEEVFHSSRCCRAGSSGSSTASVDDNVWLATRGCDGSVCKTVAHNDGGNKLCDGDGTAECDN